MGRRATHRTMVIDVEAFAEAYQTASYKLGRKWKRWKDLKPHHKKELIKTMTDALLELGFVSRYVKPMEVYDETRQQTRNEDTAR